MDLIIHSNLLELNLSGNNFGNGGAERFAPALYHYNNAKLLTLDISKCRIDVDGQLSIFEALKLNYCL